MAADVTTATQFESVNLYTERGTPLRAITLVISSDPPVRYYIIYLLDSVAPAHSRLGR